MVLIDKKGERELLSNLFSVRDIAVLPGTDKVAVTATVYLQSRDIRGKVIEASSKLPDGAFGTSAQIQFAIELRYGKKKIGQDYDAAWDAAFSPKGKKVAYKVMKDGKMGVAAEDSDKAPAKWDYVTRPVLSASGKEAAFIANEGTTLTMAQRTQRGAWRARRGGTDQVLRFDLKHQDEPETYGEPAERIESLTFGPNKGQLAYAVRTGGKWRVHCGSFTSDPFDEIGPLQFNEKGTIIGFGARSGTELLWRTLAMDDERGGGVGYPSA